jgi:hypothetical protein
VEKLLPTIYPFYLIPDYEQILFLHSVDTVIADIKGGFTQQAGLLGPNLHTEIALVVSSTLAVLDSTFRFDFLADRRSFYKK